MMGTLQPLGVVLNPGLACGPTHEACRQPNAEKQRWMDVVTAAHAQVANGAASDVHGKRQRQIR